MNPSGKINPAGLPGVYSAKRTSHATNYKPVAYRTQTYADFGINVPAISGGEWRATCPQCSHTRKKSSDRCLSVNVTKGTWYCHHCQFTGGLSDKSFDDLRRIENRRAQQSEIDLAMIVVEIAKTERARGVIHSESDLATISKSVALLKTITPSQRKLSEPNRQPKIDISDEALKRTADKLRPPEVVVAAMAAPIEQSTAQWWQGYDRAAGATS